MEEERDFSVHLEANPLRIFPEEIWEMIFNNLSDPKDLSSLLHVTPHSCFNRILKKRKALFLFRDILPILAKRQNVNQDDILTIRQVSKDWLEGCDNYFQKVPCIKNLDDEQDHKLLDHDHFWNCWLKQTCMMFHEPEDIETLNEHLTNYSGNCPFVTRSIFVGDHLHHAINNGDADAEISRMWTLVLELLSKYGENIYNFEFFSTAKRTSPVYYSMLLDALERLPNLRKLQIHFDIRPGHILNESYTRLRQQRQLPPLNSLQGLKLGSAPSILLNDILSRYSSQLNNFSLSMPEEFDHLYTFDPDIPLENLTYLAIPVRYDHHIWELEKTNWFPNLRTLIIRDITIQFITQRRTNMEKLFEMISTKAGENLEHLRLEFRPTLHDGDGWKCRGAARLDTGLQIKCEKIKKITILSKALDLNTIDFILGVQKTLQELNIILEENSPSGFCNMDDLTNDYCCCSRNALEKERLLRFGKIEFVAFWKKMYESNIWEVMPKLEKLCVTLRIRDGNSYNYLGQFHYNREYYVKSLPK